MRKDVSSVSASTKPGIRKRQHIIEVCNFVDAGTSIALFAQGRRGLPRTNRDGSGDQLFADLWSPASDDL
jgi:hypothetical protein